MNAPASTAADVLVIFGITGDLAKKMTFRSLYRLERRGMLDCPIVGVALDDWSVATLREHARQAIEGSGETSTRTCSSAWRSACRWCRVISRDAKTYDRVAKAIEGRHAPVFYLEIPPSLFGRVVEGLAHANLTGQARVVVEKPFGHDLASARALNDQLRGVLEEWQIFRIDHFLGKEPAMDILFLRFANSIFEPLWNRDRIQCVHITMAENFGVEDRGSFYDPVGALRDVVQNHLLQLIGLFAAEPPSIPMPTGCATNALRCSGRCRRSIPSITCGDSTTGTNRCQGVKPDSQTETFAALRLEIDNWRWSGVPFFIRAGKALPVRATEIRVIFKRPPKLAFSSLTSRTPTNSSCGSIPDRAQTLVIQVKEPAANTTRTVDLSLIFSEELGEAPEPYERLLCDAMCGDSSQFTREDGVEETWRIVQPLLDAPPPVEPYKAGTWGPPERRQTCCRASALARSLASLRRVAP